MEELLERISVAVAALEGLVSRMGEREVAVSAAASGSGDEQVGSIVATVESEREAELRQRLEAAEVTLAEAEAKIASAEARVAELSAAAAVSASAAVSAPVAAAGRKTMAPGVTRMLAKQGVSAGSLEGLEAGRFEAGALDAALGSLSIEQRFAVKAEMLRAGLLG